MIRINETLNLLEEFPNGELNITTDYLNQVSQPFTISAKLENNQEILRLYFILAHLKDLGKTDYSLKLYYMPYSRMDRDENGNCFTLKHMTDLLNSVISDEAKVSVVEPHSDVTLVHLNAERINIITPLMKHILEENPNVDVICYPDKGAKLRFSDDNVNLPVIYCNKKRDFATGKILGLELEGDIDVAGKNVLVLDDLCSRGGTFYYTANELKEHGVNSVYLGVCHMESTIRYGKIYIDKNVNNNSVIKHIYGFDTMLPEVEAYWLQDLGKNITIYKMDNYLKDNEFIDYSEK